MTGNTNTKGQPPYLIIILFSILVIIAIYFAGYYKLKDSNAAYVSASGYIISILGTFISIIGFAFTIYQLLRTQNATIKASEALATARKEYASFHIARETQNAKTSCELAKSSIQSCNWNDALRYIDQVRDSLVRISIENNDILKDTESVKDYASSMVQHYKAVSLKISTDAEISTDEIVTDILNVEILIIEIDTRLRQGIANG